MTDIDWLWLGIGILTMISISVIMVLFWITWSKIELIYNILLKKWDGERNGKSS